MEKLGALSDLCGKKQCGGNRQHFAGTLPLVLGKVEK